MARDVRRRLIEGAARLLAQRGLQATSFSQLLELTQTPRGSLYHHFPQGKDQLVNEAIELVGARTLEMLNQKAGASAAEITEYFLHLWREVLVRSQFAAGCAVLAVTVAADSPDLLQHTAAIFRGWQTRLAELLAQGGLAPQAATQFATMLIAASEGAVVLSRAEQSLEPFESVAVQLLQQVRSLMTTSQ